MEAEALAELADAIGRPEAAMLKQRAADMQALLLGHLWDEAAGTFVNRFPNGSSGPVLPTLVWQHRRRRPFLVFGVHPFLLVPPLLLYGLD